MTIEKPLNVKIFWFTIDIGGWAVEGSADHNIGNEWAIFMNIYLLWMSKEKYKNQPFPLENVPKLLIFSIRFSFDSDFRETLATFVIATRSTSSFPK